MNSMKKLTKSAIGTLIVGSFIALVTVVSPIAPTTYAQSCDEGISGGAQSGINCAQGEGTPNELFGGEGSIFTTVVNILLFIIGAISVIMLIIGGIRYTISAGDSGNVTAAKNTILYAIIGLVVAFLAYAVVNWVLGAVAAA
tara:strand:+ start:80 stop:505 length:426 start_codon:yes stop_codon:yes gene_type:complete